MLGKHSSGEPVRIDTPIDALDVDTHALCALESRPDANQSHLACVRDVEVRPPCRVQLRPSTYSAAQRNGGGFTTKCVPQQPSQRRSACHPAPPQRERSEASRTRLLGCRKTSEELRLFAGITLQRTQPQGESRIGRWNGTKWRLHERSNSNSPFRRHDNPNSAPVWPGCIRAGWTVPTLR